MRAPKRNAALAATLAALLWPAGGAEAQVRAPVTAFTAFNNDCLEVVTSEISGARTETRVAAFVLTHSRIVSSLQRAHRRGVSVRVKYDAEQAKNEQMLDAIKSLKKSGIECTPIAKGERGFMHHKFIVIDRCKTITGSFNYTVGAATVNDENLVVLDSPRIAADYLREFDRLK